MSRPKLHYVDVCVCRQDGGYLVRDRKGEGGSSPVALPEGTAFTVWSDGIVRKPDGGRFDATDAR